MPTIKLVCASCLIALAVCLAMFAFTSGLRPSDDQTYLYSLGSRHTDQRTYDAAITEQIAELKQEGYPTELAQRFQFRTEYAQNYFLHGVAVASLKAVLPTPAPDTHAGWTYVVNQAAVLILSALALVGIVFLLLRLPGPMAAACVLAFLYFALMSFLPPLGHRLFAEGDLKDLLVSPLKAGYFFASPGQEYDLFGPTPRNVALLFAAAAVLARWLSKPATVYWLVVAVTLCHATYGGMVLFMFLGLDIAVTPQRLRRWTVAAPVLIALAWFCSFGLSFGAFNAWLPLALALAFGLVIAGAATPWSQNLLERNPVVRQARRWPPLWGDLAALTLAAAAVFSLAMILTIFTSGETSKYISEELSGRPLAIFRIPWVLTACAIVVPWLATRSARAWQPALVVATICVCGLLLARTVTTFQAPPSTGDVLAGATLGPADVAKSFGEKELAIYYDMVRRFDVIDTPRNSQ